LYQFRTLKIKHFQNLSTNTLKIRICIYIYDFGTRKIAHMNVGTNKLVIKVTVSADHRVVSAACLDAFKQSKTVTTQNNMIILDLEYCLQIHNI